MKNLFNNTSKTAKVTALSLALATAATSVFAYTNTNKPAVEQNDAVAAMQAKLSVDQALNIANKQVDGKPLKVEFDQEDGKAIYEVEVLKGQKIHEIAIDANSGKVLEADTEALEKDDVNEVGAFNQARISLPQAMSIAQSNQSGKVVGAEFEIGDKDDKHQGKIVYEVELVSGKTVYDITVDANTGNVLASEIDQADQEDEGGEYGEQDEARETAETGEMNEASEANEVQNT